MKLYEQGAEKVAGINPNPPPSTRALTVSDISAIIFFNEQRLCDIWTFAFSSAAPF